MIAQFTRPDLVTLPIDDIPPAELYLCTLRTNHNAGVEQLRRVTRTAAAGQPH